MTARPKVIVSWSSGKDSAWTLYRLRQRDDVDVVGLLTTVDERTHSVAIHGVGSSLLELQETATGLPLIGVAIPWPCSNEVYEKRVGATFRILASGDIRHVAFGDLFLTDLRSWRERRLAEWGITPLFPLWGADTLDLAHEMIDGGLRAVVTSVDLARLPAEFAGREYDAAFLADLPEEVDPCGERGEFHTFVTDGPMFSQPIDVQVGATTCRDGFALAELTPAPHPSS